MSKLFFEDLELPRPARYLKVGSATHAQTFGKDPESYATPVVPYAGRM